MPSTGKFLRTATLIFATIALLLITIAVSHANSTQGEVEAIWRKARQAATFQFETNALQTTHLVPHPANAGRRPHTDQLLIESSVDNVNEAMQMSLETSLGGGRERMNAKAENGTAYIQNAQGEWEENPELLNMVAPGSDPMAFLHAMENVQKLEAGANPTDESATFLSGEQPLPLIENVVRYAFAIDGAALGDYLRQQSEAYLRDHKGMPNGMHTESPEMYQNASGRGELWVSTETGLPLQQRIAIEFPAQEGALNYQSVDMVTTYDAWQLRSVAQIVYSVNGALQPLAVWLVPSAENLTNFARLTLLISVAAVFAFAIGRSGHNRRAYRAFAVTMVLAMVVSPLGHLLTGRRAEAFVELMDAEQAQREAEQAEVAEQQATFDNAFGNNDFSPVVSPLAQTQSAFEGQGRQLGLSAESGALTGTDSDSDFLDDEVEIYELGTFYDAYDTDGDYISDGSEVYGFEVGGTTWYLDPWAIDSNNDGLTDVAECPQRADTDEDGTPLTDEGVQVDFRANACQDTDGDGVPDVWDYDNDGDSVPDSADISPFDAQPFATTARDRFNFAVSDFEANELLMLDLRLRPANPDHLWLSGNVYDWPSNDDSGQVTRVLDNTFADFGYTTNNAGNGDLMVIPQVEISIPWDASNPSGGLPISSTATITQGTPTSDWLDTSITDEFDLAITKDTTTGDLLIYAPVYDIQDDVGDNIVSWQTNIPYLPTTTDWGSDHQYRLTWLVLALTDECDTSGMSEGDVYSEYCAASNTDNWSSDVTVVHTYYEDFYVTGMSIEEEQGLTGAYVAQFDEVSQSYPADLWHFTDAAYEIMSEGALKANGDRFAIADVVERFDNDSTVYADGAAEKWGISADSLNAVSYSYDTVTLGIAELAAEMEGFLDATFPTVSTGDTVTVLQLRESTSRSYAYYNSETDFDVPSSTVTLSLSDTVESLYAALVWSTYQKTNDGWENADEETYLDWLEGSLSAEFTDQEVATQFDATVDADVARYVAVEYATQFFTAMETGSATLVETDGVAVSDLTLSDADYALANDTEVALQVAQEAANYFYSFIDGTATVVLDGVETVIAPYYEIDSFSAFLELYAVYSAEISADASFSTLSAELTASTYIMNAAMTQFITYQMTNFGNTAGRFTTFYLVYGMYALMVTAAIISLIAALAGYDDASEGIFVAVSALISVISLARTLGQANKALKVIAGVVTYILAIGLEGVPAKARLIQLTATLTNIRRQLSFNIVLDFIVSVVVSLVVFFALTAANNWTEKDIEYQLLLAYTVASIVVSTFIFVFLALLLLLAALSATGVGIFVVLIFVILLAFIAVIDLIMYAICYFTGADDVDEGEDLPLICKGFLGTVIMAIADAIYEYHNPIDFENEERLNIDIASIDLVNQTKGFQVGNQLDTTMTVESRLYPNQPDFDFAWRGSTSSAKVKTSDIDSASFAYSLDNSISIHDVPNSTDWTKDASGDFVSHTYTLTKQIRLDDAGINLGFDYKLGEAYEIPLMNCWWAVVGWVCNLDSETESATFHDLDDVFTLDIFPETFADFVALEFETDQGWRMGWDETFPALMDADGDGLISQYFNGADPDDSSADTDGDGLSDYYEETNSANGFNARLADSDGDGLSDYWELFYGSDVSDSDTDNDGLLDGEEVFHPDRHPSDKEAVETFSGGWEIVYDYAADKTPYKYHVSSDLALNDADGDDNYDYYEYIYRYNPNVMNDLDIFSAQAVTFDYPGAEGYAKPGNTIPYEMVLFGELDSTLVSYGLLEAELPRDVVQEQQAFELVGQNTITMSGSLYVDPVELGTTQAVSMTLRAGAFTEPVDTTDPASTVFAYLPMSKLIDTTNPYQYYNLSPDLAGNHRNWRCQDNENFQSCPTVADGATHFDGATYLSTESYAERPFNQVDIADEAAWTISYWINPDSAASDDVDRLLRLWYFRFGVQTDMLLTEFTNQTSTIQTDIQINNSCETATVAGGSTLNFDEWNHVVLTYDGAHLTHYINGVAGSSVAANQICDRGVDFSEIGGHISGGGFVGGMRDYVAYTEALSAEAIRREAARGFRRLDLNFDEHPASESFADTRGFDLSATCNSNQDQCPLSGVAGVSNQAIVFDGDDKLTLSADSDAFGLAINDEGVGDFRASESSFTAMGWISADSFDLSDSLFSFTGSEEGIVYPITDDESDYYTYSYATDMWFGFTNGTPAFSVDNALTILDATNTTASPTNETYTFDSTATTQFATDDLHHVAFVYDAAALQIRIYVDGTLEEQYDVSENDIAIPNDMQLVIGDGFSGRLDHFVLSTRAQTVDEIQAIMKESPAVNLHLDEDIDTTSFVNSGTGVDGFTCSAATCPSAGADGQMREAARFSADGSLDEYISADSPTIADDSYTVGFWFYSEDTLNDAQTLFADDGYGYQPIIRLESDRTLSFLHQLGDRSGSACTRTYRQYTTTNTFDEEQWQHVVFVFDVSGETVTAFINGVQTALTQAAGTVTEACPTVEDAVIIGESFIGEIDEIVYYQSELLDIEAEAIFDYQSAWYDLRVQPSLQIDADKPVVEMVLGNRFHAGTYQDTMIPIQVSDIGAGVEQIVIETYNNGSGLPFDTTTLTRTETTDYWIFTLPDATDGTEADLVFRYYAVDGVGNHSEEAVSFLWGDPHVPNVNVDGTSWVSDTVTVSGTIDDGVLSRPDDSGVVEDSFQLRLAHQNGVDSSDTYSPTITNGDWSQVFAFDTTLPYGTYNVEAYVEDVAGNVMNFDVIDAVTVDALAPFADMAAATATISTSTSALFGAFHQLGYPTDTPAMLLHFDANAPLEDSSGVVQQVTCAACPSSAAGLYENAATFAGGENLSADFHNNSNELTIMGWFKPTWNGAGYDPELFSYEADSMTRFSLSAADDMSKLILNDGTTTTEISATLTANTWQHIALIVDDAGYVAVYLDGEQVYWALQTVGAATDGALAIGTGFVGQVDDFAIYSRALLDNELYDMANPVDAGLTLDKLYIRYAYVGDTADRAWEEVTFATDSALYATWSDIVPDELEGLYRVELLARDSGGFERTEVVWTGLLDNIAPRVSLDQVSAETIVCTISDFNLDIDSVDCPIDATETVTVTADSLDWYADIYGAGTVGSVISMMITGTLASDATVDDLAIACDTLGQCQDSALTISYNRAPVALDDDYTLNDGVVLVVDSAEFGLLNNDADADDDPLSVVAVGEPLYGSIIVDASGTFTYTSADGDAHTDVFTYTVSDGEDTDDATITITMGDCRASETVVTTEAELDDAIACFNGATSGSYQITFGADITRTKNTVTIDNANAELTLDGNGHALDGDNIYRILVVSNLPHFTLTDITVANGYNGFTSSGGGGIKVDDSTFTVRDVTFRGNDARFYGGAIFADDSVIHIENSLFDNNSSNAQGSAIHLLSDNTVTITNTTFYNNVSGDDGGWSAAIHVNFRSVLDLNHVTLTTDNASSDYGLYVQRGTTTVANSVFAGFATSCGSDATLLSGGYNLTDDASCFAAATDINNTDPLLGTLQDNGGATQTQLPANNSPLIDATGTCSVNTDQRGAVRDDLACDIGAVEVTLDDYDTIVQQMAAGEMVSFGPTMVEAEITNDGGCLTGLSVTQHDEAHPNDTSHIQNRYWTIEPSGCTTGFEVTLVLPSITTGDGEEVCRWDTDATAWDCAATARDGTRITRSGVTEFSDWAVRQATPTAVELVGISAETPPTIFLLLSTLLLLTIGQAVCQRCWQKRNR